jgi:WD40 repeat protein
MIVPSYDGLSLKHKYLHEDQDLEIFISDLHKEKILMVERLSGGRILTSSEDKTMNVIDKRLELKCVKVSSPVTSFVETVDSKFYFTASVDNEIGVWLDTWVQLYHLH